MCPENAEKIERVDGESHIEVPETPEELFAAVQELEGKVVGREEEALSEIKELAIAIKSLKLAYKDNPEIVELLDEAMNSLYEIEISFYSTDYKGEGADLNRSYKPEEAEEQRAYLEKYRYSEDEFSSEDEYMDFLAQNLTSLEEINLFLKYLYRYDLTSEKTRSQFIENQGTTYSADWWRSPLQISTEYNQSEGRFFGDCDDIAILFEEILSRQGKNPFFFIIPGHALTGWIEEDSDGRYIAYVVDTTSVSRDLGDGECKKLEGKAGQTQEEVFEELVNSFSRESDAHSEFNTDQMNLGFYISGKDVAFDIPANFALAQRYHELKAHLMEENFAGILEILNEEIERDPGSINLKIARLQFQLLMNADYSEIQQSIQDIVAMYAENTENRNARNNLNQTAYFLTKKGYTEESIDLLAPLIEKYNEVFFDINLNDTLSDLYVGNNDFESAYQNDVRSLQEIARAEESIQAEFGGIAPIKYWEIYGVMSMDVFRDMITSRLNNNPAYKAYVLQKDDIPDFFRK